MTVGGKWATNAGTPLNRVKAYQIFQSISPDLAQSIFQTLRDDHRDVYKSILISLAQEKRLRPVFVQRKPVEQQIKWMGDTCKLRACNSVTEHLLQIWLLKSQPEMLKAFLDDLGVEHDDEGTAEDLPDELDAKKLKKAAEGLLKSHPAETVALYLHVFQLQQPGGWPELNELLEKDERLALGEQAKASSDEEEEEK